MKRTLLITAALAITATFCAAQNRQVARAATPGEFYWSGSWYSVEEGQGPYNYDTLRYAIFRLTENGKKLTVQYNIDLANPPEGFAMLPTFILADATPGVIYNRYPANNHTALYRSFDYGLVWELIDYNIGTKGYFSANYEGIIYRTGTDGRFISEDFGNTFNKIEIIAPGTEPGLLIGEAFSIGANIPYQGRILHTYNYYETYVEFQIPPEFMYGQLVGGYTPDVYRGALPGEVYVSSWFPGWDYKVSFSNDLGETFRHVYVCEGCYPFHPDPDKRYNNTVFMSDREPGVFYILRLVSVPTQNPIGGYVRMLVHYYRDYGETLEASFLHNLTSDYEYEEVVCDNVTSLEIEKVNENSIQLQWVNTTDHSLIRGYHVYRNDTRITGELLINAQYTDENLPGGEYEYYVRTYHVMGCVSDGSNVVTVTIKEKYEITFTVIDTETKLPIPEAEITVFNCENPFFTDEAGIAVVSFATGNYPYVVSKENYDDYTGNLVVDNEAKTEPVEMIKKVGIEQLRIMNYELRVYPNPTTGELVVIDNGQLTIDNVEVFDVLGRKQKAESRKENGGILIDVSGLSGGIYFLRVQTERGFVIKKVVKQ